MTFLIFTGSYPPDKCGVGDYVQAFSTALSESGHRVEILKDRWKSVLRILKRNRLPLNSTFLSIQYPTAGYGKSLAPHAAAWVGHLAGVPVATTFHEYSSLSRRARIAARVMFHFSRIVTFTTQYERTIAEAECPWIKGRTITVPIGCNIPASHERMLKNIDVCYFGNISPGKGIEAFLRVCSQLPMKTIVYLIGATPQTFREYWQDIVTQCSSLGVTTMLNQQPHEVASLLSSAKIALLPFPDGISMRRGSALAAMANGALVVTAPSSYEKDLFAGLSYCCSSEEEMISTINKLLEGDTDNAREKRSAAIEFVGQLKWQNIAGMFVEAMSRMEVDQTITRAGGLH